MYYCVFFRTISSPIGITQRRMAVYPELTGVKAVRCAVPNCTEKQHELAQGTGRSLHNKDSSLLVWPTACLSASRQAEPAAAGTNLCLQAKQSSMLHTPVQQLQQSSAFVHPQLQFDSLIAVRRTIAQR